MKRKTDLNPNQTHTNTSKRPKQQLKTLNDMSAMMDTDEKQAEEMDIQNPLVYVKHLTFNYFEKKVLYDINLKVMPGQRCLVVGANGAGKSTLLRVLAGRHMPPSSCEFSVLGTRAPQDQIGGLAFLGNNWSRTVAFAASNVAYQCDMPVRDMMSKLQMDYPERRDMLVKLLGVDLNWRMHQVSDGQRRRVQIMLGLIKPFRVLLMDEITVDLDLVARQDLLNFLKSECETRGACILYATHIFDGLDDWTTHVMYLKAGKTYGVRKLSEFDGWSARKNAGEHNPLLRTVEARMRAERKEEQNFEEAEMLVHEKAHKAMGPQGGFASGRASMFAAGRMDAYR
jgi:CCR4-NOT complex subunit CAF16